VEIKLEACSKKITGITGEISTIFAGYCKTRSPTKLGIRRNLNASYSNISEIAECH
jgi:hypothetical protein